MLETLVMVELVVADTAAVIPIMPNLLLELQILVAVAEERE